MKLFSLIISFIIINVSADYQADYRRLVLLANLSIERAFNMNDITVGGNSVANGLEHVIEIMVNDNSNITNFYKHFAKLNFMIAVPEHRLIVNYIPEWEQYTNNIKTITYQDAMRWQIKHTLEIDDPEIDNNQDFRALDLTNLADKRREFVVPALKNIIRRVLAEPVHDDAYLLRLCRLAGLLTSTQSPTSYIRLVEIDSINITCTLWHGVAQKIIYRKISGVWEQTKEDGTVQTLEDQLS